MVDSLFNGNAVSVLYYGLGGTGKEYTMRGTSAEPGTVNRAFAQIQEKRKELGTRGQVLTVLPFPCSIFVTHACP